MCDKITPDVIHVQYECGLYGSQSGVEITGFILGCKIANEPVVTTLHTVHPELKNFSDAILRTIVGESALRKSPARILGRRRIRGEVRGEVRLFRFIAV